MYMYIWREVSAIATERNANIKRHAAENIYTYMYMYIHVGIS